MSRYRLGWEECLLIGLSNMWLFHKAILIYGTEKGSYEAKYGRQFLMD